MGAIVDSGGLVVMDNHTCMVELARFFRELLLRMKVVEKCVPCREEPSGCWRFWNGSFRVNGEVKDLDTLDELARTITDTAAVRTRKERGPSGYKYA